MITVVLCEPSYIVRKGIAQLLAEFPKIGRVLELTTADALANAIDVETPEIVIANTFFDQVLRENLSKENPNGPVVLYLYHSPLPHGESPTHISIFEDKATLSEKIGRAVTTCLSPKKEMDGEDLSPREKLVLKQVALGMTNKEIADTLFISTHTVISHRKNITKKLGIKTVSGLTVYAILNKLVGIEDVS